MTIFEKIRQLLSGNKTHEVPESYCPNCWGRQEYEGAFLEAIREEQIDLNNLEQKRGWVDAYAIRHFEGIRLKPVKEGFICAQCNTIYKR